MSIVKVKNLTVEFQIHAVRGFSLRNFMAGKLLGGKFGKKHNSKIVRALDNVSFEIKARDRVGFILQLLKILKSQERFLLYSVYLRI